MFLLQQNIFVKLYCKLFRQVSMNQDKKPHQGKTVKHQDKPIHPPVLGGYQQLDTHEADKVVSFLNETAKEDLKDLKLVQYFLQIVNGWHHRLIYEDHKQNKIIYLVHQSHEHKFENKGKTVQEKKPQNQ